MPKETGRKLIAQNKKARHDYHLEDVFEAGLVLTGTEVKSLRAGRASLVDAYARIKDGKAKVEIALARGKRAYDKRQTLAARDAEREIARASGRRAKGREE